MSKRFLDTDLWNKQWFQELSLKEKIFLKYIYENCDCAGVWETNYRLASFIIGEEVNKQTIDSINNKKEQFIFISDNKLFIKNFIQFQYGTLSEDCKPHKPVIEKLKKYNLYEKVLKGFSKGIYTLKEKEKEQYKEKDKEKDKEKENTCNDFFNLYNSTVKNLPKIKTIGESRKKKIKTRLKELPFDDWKAVFEKCDNSSFCCGNNNRNWQASFDWLIENDNNYIKVLEGKYDNKEEFTDKNKLLEMAEMAMKGQQNE